MKIRSHALPEFLLVTLLLFTNPLFGEVASAPGGLPLTEVYFSPETDILQLFRQQIDLTKDSLYAAVCSIDLGELVQALVEAKKRGVKVRLILDEESVRENPTLAKFLQGEGLEVKLLKGDAGGRMNNNFAIFDNKELLTGSYNWTEKSQRFNLESVLLTNEPAVVETYIKEFDRLAGPSKEMLIKKPFVSPLPPKELPPKEAEEKGLLDISFQDLEKVFGEESMLSSGQKKRAWNDYQGKYVRWQGVVIYRGIGRMDWNKVGISHSLKKEADVEVAFNWNTMGDILALQVGDSITYTARLSKRGRRGSPYRLEDGELQERK